VVDQPDRHFRLGADAADGQPVVPESLEAFYGRIDERLAAFVRELALEARLPSLFLDALQSGSFS
jgi:hypothetical protein